mgnify:CR=1 FL=1
MIWPVDLIIMVLVMICGIGAIMVRDLLGEYQTAVLYITHNLGVVARYVERIYVMYAGRII